MNRYHVSQCDNPAEANPDCEIVIRGTYRDTWYLSAPGLSCDFVAERGENLSELMAGDVAWKPGCHTAIILMSNTGRLVLILSDRRV